MSSQHWLPTIFKHSSNMLFAPVVLLVFRLAATVEATPPTIVRQPPRELLFHVRLSMEDAHRPVVLMCAAKGDPEPEYKWTKDKQEFDFASQDGRISRQPGRGTLVITAPQHGDEGLYQCQATNELGTSLSDVVLLRKVELKSFPDEDTKDVFVKEGEPLSFRCDPPSGYPRPNVTWVVQHQNGGVSTINSTRITVDPEGGLHFSRVALADAVVDGGYACTVASTFLLEYKLGQKIRLHVEPTSADEMLNVAPVKQYTSPENIVALYDSELKLHCIYGGTPPPVTSWFLYGVNLSTLYSTYADNGKTLIIPRLKFHDGGEYECAVDNGVGPALRHTMLVQVEVAPLWRTMPENIEAAEGERVELDCGSVGYPKPNLEWLVNGEPISNSEPNPRRSFDGDVITLRSVEVTDTAVYQCNASNTHGYVFRDFYLNVAGHPPTFADEPESVTAAVVRSNVTLRCSALGAPRPHVLWLKDGRSLREARYHVTDWGDLEIVNAQFADEGEYVCRATNKFGQASASSYLQVQRRTRITLRPPDEYESAVGKRVTFRCGAGTDARRNLTIEWLFNGKPLDHDGDPRLVVLTDNSLAITRTVPLDAGKYTCKAHTRIDTDFADTTLIVQGVPSPPELLHVDCNSLVAVIEWKPTLEWGTPVLSYLIQYNTEFNGENWKDAAVNIPETETKSYVSRSPGTNYTFRVLARNKYGYSPPSEASSKCTTPEDVPHKNPYGVIGRGDLSDNLVISWTPMPPYEHNAPGFFYKVLWKRDDIPEATWNSQSIEDWRQNRYVVNDQPTFKPYRIKVEAHNRRGQANTAAKDVIGYSGEDVPLAAPADFRLVQVLDGRSAEFAWSPVDHESVRGHFRGYKLETCTPEEFGSTQRDSAVPPDATTAIVSLFRPYSRNLVSLRVFNEKHNGPATDTIEFTTPEGTPGPVGSLEAIPLGSTAFYLVWTQPPEPNGVLTGYRIFYEEVRGTYIGVREERRKSIEDPLVLHAKLAGLKPGTNYRVSIRATTAEGLGDPYFVEAKTGDLVERLPDISDFAWMLLPGGRNKEAVQVTWLPAIKGHPGSHFYVQYRRKGDEIWENTLVEEYEDTIVVHGLEKGAVYEIRVVAVDGKHERHLVIKEIDTGVPESHAARSASSTSTFKTMKQSDPLEASTNENERAMDQMQQHFSILLTALDRQAKILEELKVAMQNGFSELQLSLRHTSQPPMKPVAGPAT